MPYQVQKHVTKKQNTTQIDRLMMVAAIIHPLMTTPQVIQIYTTHDVSGISLLTWFGYMTLGIIFLTYALAHKLRPIIITQVLWFAMDVLVVGGVLLYR